LGAPPNLIVDYLTILTAYPKTGTRSAGASRREEVPHGESL
jgi:hypothetical protein